MLMCTKVAVIEMCVELKYTHTFCKIFYQDILYLITKYIINKVFPNKKMVVGPKYEYFADNLYRILSFDWGWSGAVNISKMAEAGFFFNGGREDSVECFHCGIHLDGWQRIDDPWCKHFYANPNCEWVKRNMTLSRLRKLEFSIIFLSRGGANANNLLYHLHTDYGNVK